MSCCCGHHHHCSCHGHHHGHHHCGCQERRQECSCHSEREDSPRGGRREFLTREEYIAGLDEEREILERRLRYLKEELDEVRKGHASE
ncbi:MAG: hypothetical protein ACHQ7N_12270 [Candidatus Methylomirabilales bacterium]